MICEACFEEVDEIVEYDEMKLCEECCEHYRNDEAMRDEELRQMNEDLDAEFGGEEEEEP